MPLDPALRKTVSSSALIGFVVVFAVALTIALIAGVDAVVAVLAAFFGAVVIGGGLGALFGSRVATGRTAGSEERI